MLAADSHPQPNAPLTDTLTDTLTTIGLSAILLLLLPITILAAFADFLWFRLRTTLRGPQRQKGVWEF